MTNQMDKSCGTNSEKDAPKSPDKGNFKADPKRTPEIADKEANNKKTDDSRRAV